MKTKKTKRKRPLKWLMNSKFEVWDGKKWLPLAASRVYAEFDGYMIILTTRNGYPDDPRNTIALEPSVLAALNAFAQRTRDM